MASSDPLQALRESISAGKPPLLSKAAEATSANDIVPIAQATYLQFNHNGIHQSFSLSSPTRFAPNGNPVDLRSVYFAWLNKDVGVPDYIAAAQQSNQELAAPGGAGGTITNLVFLQRHDLATWLEGTSEASEFIKPLAAEEAKAQADAAANIIAGGAAEATTAPAVGAGSKTSKTVDPRLLDVYNLERKLGDRNTVLRGIKPTDFSHVRKNAAAFLQHSRSRPGAVPNAPNQLNSTQNPALVSNLKKPTRRAEPIVLLSPSASSLLRMSNIRSFLGEGLYQPADTSAATSSILHIQRMLPTIDPSRPLRFILVDTPDQFKPDYWQRVVAVFTTGQTWQFKSYKWTQPSELFAHVLGIYVGWRGEDVPNVVRGWGRGVMHTQVDKWTPHQGTHGRWRDREVVEGIWTAIEESMRAKGWGKDGTR